MRNYNVYLETPKGTNGEGGGPGELMYGETEGERERERERDREERGGGGRERREAKRDRRVKHETNREA